MKAIVAVDKNWAIGNCGDLLCHLPGDLLYFKEKTRGKMVIMGRNTFESLPNSKPLTGRANTVLSRNPDFQAPCCVCRNDGEIKSELAKYDDENVYVIGGESIYRQYLSQCDTVYVTKILSEFCADTFFPNLDEDQEFKLVWESDLYEEKGIPYRFTEYRRVKGSEQEG